MISGAKKNLVLISICAGAMAAVLTLLTQMALNAERMETQAARERLFQEAIRQALWSMDSALTPILVQESARPFEHYQAVYSDPRANVSSKKGGDPKSTSAQRLFSPLLGLRSDWIRLHFYIELRDKFSSDLGVNSIEGEACSPQVPNPGPLTPEEVENATNAFPEEVKGSSVVLSSLQTLLKNQKVLEKMGVSLAGASTKQKLPQVAQKNFSSFSSAQQQELTQQSYVDRQRNIEWAQNLLTINTPSTLVANLEPTWLLPPLTSEPELFLLRTLRLGPSQEVLLGVWLDWPQLKKRLCQGSVDIFPNLQIRPIQEGDQASQGRMLATIPAVLEPGSWKGPEANSISVIRWLIVGAWAISVAAFVALFTALSSATELSERRGRFVSAVTHELRTPLTTFQLYSQMLADGMVPDEKSRAEYLATLKAESERLARIVDNVLLYARVEGKRTVLHRESIAAGALLARMAPALTRRAQEAGMILEIAEGSAAQAMLHTDPQIVEQILFNLVDNSCKYAREAADRRIPIELRTQEKQLEILVCDRGPGIPPQERSKLFEPFQRGEAHVAGSVPGIGLGLSLSRALARDLGGELTLVPRNEAGACFALRLPLEIS